MSCIEMVDSHFRHVLLDVLVAGGRCQRQKVHCKQVLSKGPGFLEIFELFLVKPDWKCQTAWISSEFDVISLAHWVIDTTLRERERERDLRICWLVSNTLIRKPVQFMVHWLYFKFTLTFFFLKQLHILIVLLIF